MRAGSSLLSLEVSVQALEDLQGFEESGDQKLLGWGGGGRGRVVIAFLMQTRAKIKHCCHSEMIT